MRKKIESSKHINMKKKKKNKKGLKNIYYKSDIMERFMTEKQQKDFQENYDNAKARNLGNAVAYELKNTDNKFVKVGE